MSENVRYLVATIFILLFFLGIMLTFMTTNISWFLFSLICGIISRIMVKD